MRKYSIHGKELDASNNLWWYDYGARQYDPTAPRFSTPDRFAEKYYSMNMYGYCGNNPVKYINIKGDSIKFRNGVSEEFKQKKSQTMKQLIYLINLALCFFISNGVCASNSTGNINGDSVQHITVYIWDDLFMDTPFKITPDKYNENWATDSIDIVDKKIIKKITKLFNEAKLCTKDYTIDTRGHIKFFSTTKVQCIYINVFFFQKNDKTYYMPIKAKKIIDKLFRRQGKKTPFILNPPPQYKGKFKYEYSKVKWANIK